jgi:hypothetical protein
MQQQREIDVFMQSLVKRLSLAAVQAAVVVVCAESTKISGASSPPSKSDNILWYNDVSGNEWITQGLPIGNGHQAAMVSFIGVDCRNWL